MIVWTWEDSEEWLEVVCDLTDTEFVCQSWSFPLAGIDCTFEGTFGTDFETATGDLTIQPPGESCTLQGSVHE